WTAFIYFGFYHHARQYYGVLRWYQKLNGRFDPWSHWFVYALFLFPAVLFHFREEPFFGGHYTGHDLLLWPAPGVYAAGLLIYGALVTTWLLYERRQWAAGHREPNRIVAVGAPALLSGLCFFTGRSAPEVLFPLVAGHTIAYFALIGLSVERTAVRWRMRWQPAMALVLGLSAMFGAVEFAYEKTMMIWNYQQATAPLGAALAIGFYSSLVLSHYILDSVIWRGDHPDAPRLFDPPQPVPNSATV
ncbi:MAG: hypothetical protein AAF658_19620, partial [Myxococcota bacterium]